MSIYISGTIGLFVTPKKLVMAVIIYRKSDGKIKQKRLEDLEQTECGPLMMFGTKTGNMDSTVWPKVLAALAKRTRRERGCVAGTGEDWKYGAALYVDSYAVHLNREVAIALARDHGIFIRPLLRNASHLQQPVDRHIGICFKAMYKRNVLIANYSLLHMLSMSSGSELMPVNKYTQLCAGALNTCLKKVTYNLCGDG